MKLTIEKLEGRKAKMTLEFCGKSFSETWKQESDTAWCTESKGIISQLEAADIPAEGTDIEGFLDMIDVPDFIVLAESELDWD